MGGNEEEEAQWLCYSELYENLHISLLYNQYSKIAFISSSYYFLCSLRAPTAVEAEECLP